MSKRIELILCVQLRWYYFYFIQLIKCYIINMICLISIIYSLFRTWSNCPNSFKAKFRSRISTPLYVSTSVLYNVWVNNLFVLTYVLLLVLANYSKLQLLTIKSIWLSSHLIGLIFKMKWNNTAINM